MGLCSARRQVGSQPDEVEELYGKYFQNIDGDHVIWNEKNNIFIVQSDKIDLELTQKQACAMITKGTALKKKAS